MQAVSTWQQVTEVYAQYSELVKKKSPAIAGLSFYAVPVQSTAPESMAG
jgi:hypothetical protein